MFPNIETNIYTTNSGNVEGWRVTVGLGAGRSNLENLPAERY